VNTDNIYRTITSTASFTSSTTLSLVTTTTTTSSIQDAQPNAKKRSVVTVIPTAIPVYASPCTSVARYSSACSCVGFLPMSTLTVAAPVSSLSCWICVCLTCYWKQTITVTVSKTLTTTIDVTSTSTSVTIATPTLLAPAACTSQFLLLNVGGSMIKYSLVFSGIGVSEDPNNLSNNGFDPLSTTLPSSMSACEAAVSCVYLGMYSSPEHEYFNIDLHFLITDQVWSCTAYSGCCSSASDYNVAYSNIGSADGYQLYNSPFDPDF
jgi:hypothetical protein